MNTLLSFESLVEMDYSLEENFHSFEYLKMLYWISVWPGAVWKSIWCVHFSGLVPYSVLFTSNDLNKLMPVYHIKPLANPDTYNKNLKPAGSCTGQPFLFSIKKKCSNAIQIKNTTTSFLVSYPSLSLPFLRHECLHTLRHILGNDKTD